MSSTRDEKERDGNNQPHGLAHRLQKRFQEFDFSGETLSNELISVLEEKLLKDKEDNIRYSKKYLETEKINIKRGGIIKLYDEQSGGYRLFEVVKRKKPSVAEKKGSNKISSSAFNEGGLGKVKFIRDIKNKDRVLVLKVFKKAQSVSDREEAKNEAEIGEVFGIGKSFVLGKKRGLGVGDHNPIKLAIVQEYIFDDDLDAILKKEDLLLEERFNIALQLLKKINDMHNKGNGYLHCDIKGQNIKFDRESGIVTILDYGLARKLDEGKTSYVSKKFFGTKHYMPLDFKCNADGQYEYTKYNDIYAAARVLQNIFSIEQEVFIPMLDAEYTFGAKDKKFSGIFSGNEKLELVVDLMLKGNVTLESAIQQIEEIQHLALYSISYRELLADQMIEKLNSKLETNTIFLEKRQIGMPPLPKEDIFNEHGEYKIQNKNLEYDELKQEIASLKRNKQLGIKIKPEEAKLVKNKCIELAITMIKSKRKNLTIKTINNVISQLEKIINLSKDIPHTGNKFFRTLVGLVSEPTSKTTDVLIECYDNFKKMNERLQPKPALPENHNSDGYGFI